MGIMMMAYLLLARVATSSWKWTLAVPLCGYFCMCHSLTWALLAALLWLPQLHTPDTPYTYTRTFGCPLCFLAVAWLGHFGFEHNKPATFVYPTYSLFSDFVMFGQAVANAAGVPNDHGVHL